MRSTRVDTAYWSGTCDRVSPAAIAASVSTALATAALVPSAITSPVATAITSPIATAIARTLSTAALTPSAITTKATSRTDGRRRTGVGADGHIASGESRVSRSREPGVPSPGSGVRCRCRWRPPRASKFLLLYAQRYG